MVAPIEQQINGVENMLYMSSNSTGDGSFSISVTFDIGTNLDIAQVQVQNRVAVAQPRLPADVRNIGVTVHKSFARHHDGRAPLFAGQVARHAVHVELRDAARSPTRSRRVDGVGSITVFGSRDYAMRVWLDPDRLQSLGLTASDVVTALQGAERAGRLRRAQPAAGRPAARIPDRGADARPARRSERVRQYRRQADARAPWCA